MTIVCIILAVLFGVLTGNSKSRLCAFSFGFFVMGCVVMLGELL